MGVFIPYPGRSGVFYTVQLQRVSLLLAGGVFVTVPVFGFGGCFRSSLLAWGALGMWAGVQCPTPFGYGSSVNGLKFGLSFGGGLSGASVAGG